MFYKSVFLIVVGIPGCTAVTINKPHDADDEQGIPVPMGTTWWTQCKCKWALETIACDPSENNGSHCWRVCCAKKKYAGVEGLLADETEREKNANNPNNRTPGEALSKVHALWNSIDKRILSNETSKPTTFHSLVANNATRKPTKNIQPSPEEAKRIFNEQAKKVFEKEIEEVTKRAPILPTPSPKGAPQNLANKTNKILTNKNLQTKTQSPTVSTPPPEGANKILKTESVQAKDARRGPGQAQRDKLPRRERRPGQARQHKMKRLAKLRKKPGQARRDKNRHKLFTEGNKAQKNEALS